MESDSGEFKKRMQPRRPLGGSVRDSGGAHWRTDRVTVRDTAYEVPCICCGLKIGVGNSLVMKGSKTVYTFKSCYGCKWLAVLYLKPLGYSMVGYKTIPFYQWQRGLRVNNVCMCV